ncbi:MAG: hypothetical protein DRO67_05965 [Candidatus Asgardarchaeum californiense]|nr:MAG: hypothetical protein DRO67_05965 [Candidatus Asgardarchaeum californiense]
MTVAKYTNMGVATLNADITAIATSLDVASLAEANSFPSISESWDYFRMILTNTLGDYEIVKVTAKVGSTFTIERGMEGTTALAWVAGDRILGNATSALLEEMRNEGAGGEVIEKSADFTLTPEHANKTIQTTAGMTITMNPMIDFKDYSVISIKNNSGETVIVNPDGTETIDGNSSYTIKAKYSVELYKGTAGWEVKTLSGTSLQTNTKMYIQGLLISRPDVDSIVMGTGICSNHDGAVDFVIETPLTADTNHEIGLGDGGMPATVAKTGTFSSVGTAIVGTGTLFTTEFKVGDVLWSSSNNEGQVIVSVLTDTQMVIQLAFTADVASDAVMKNGLAAFAWYYPIIAYNPTTDAYKLVFDTQSNAENALADTNMTGYTMFRRRGVIGTDASLSVYECDWLASEKDGLFMRYKETLLQGTSFSPGVTLTIDSPNLPGQIVPEIAAFITSGVGSANLGIYDTSSKDKLYFINNSQSNDDSDSIVMSLRGLSNTSSLFIERTSGHGAALQINGFLDKNLD